VGTYDVKRCAGKMSDAEGVAAARLSDSLDK